MVKNPLSPKVLWLVGIIAAALTFDTFGQAIYISVADPAKAPMVKIAVLVATAVLVLQLLSSWVERIIRPSAEAMAPMLGIALRVGIFLLMMDLPLFFGLAWFSHPKTWILLTAPLLLALARIGMVWKEGSKLRTIFLALWAAISGILSLAQVHVINRKFYGHAIAGHRPVIPEWFKIADLVVTISAVALVMAVGLRCP